MARIGESKQAVDTCAGPTIAELIKASEILNLKEVARRLRMPEQTLYAKVRRGTELKPKEAIAIARELNEAGLHLVAQAV